MRSKALWLAMSAAFVVASAPPAYADDGERLVRNVSSSPGTTENPEPEGEHAFIKLMNFHVPAQLASGELTTIEYNNIDDVLVKEEAIAKPLISAYVYGPVIGFEEPEASGFVGHGRRDAFGAVSLDDGETWKTTNLSNSADKSSFEVSTPLQDPGGDAVARVRSDRRLDRLRGPVRGEGRHGGVLRARGTDADPGTWVYIRDAITHQVSPNRVDVQHVWRMGDRAERSAGSPLLYTGR